MALVKMKLYAYVYPDINWYLLFFVEIIQKVTLLFCLLRTFSITTSQALYHGITQYFIYKILFARKDSNIICMYILQ